MEPMSIDEIARLLQHPINLNRGEKITKGVSVDSRLTRPGDLFFALAGANADGHDFLSEVAAKGAVAAIVSSEYRGPDFGMALIHSKDRLHSLQLLAKILLARSKCKIVAVTGSLGKTTTKDFISHFLKSQYRVHSTPGNSNSQIGLPLTLLNHTALDEEILVLEMGMTTNGQIAQLTQIAPPTVSVVTTVALVHAINFDSFEKIAEAKGEIFLQQQTQMGIYHKESDINKKLSSQGSCQKLSFSTTSSDSNFYLDSNADKTIKIKDPCSNIVQLPQFFLPGEHNKHNLLAATAVARHLGISWENICERVPQLTLPERRLQIIEKQGITFVNDSYNASEMSMKAALSSLPKPKVNGRRFAVLAGMVELGKYSQEAHRAVAEFALQHIDMMICFGEECLEIADCWQKAQRPVFWGAERSEIVPFLRSQIRKGDVVLLKGSRVNAVWKVLDELESV